MSDSKIRIENGVSVADVFVGDKSYVVKAKKVKELREIMQKITKDKNLQTEGDAVENIDKLVKMCKLMFPEINPDDIDNAYMSQLVELTNLWQELNFSELEMEGSST